MTSGRSNQFWMILIILLVAIIISVGDNRYGHPSPEVIARLEDSLGPAAIYRTDEQGTIEFITDGERLWVAVEKPK